MSSTFVLPSWISVLQYSDWISPRKFILDESLVVFCLVMILLNGILSPRQLIICSLMLVIDLSFLLGSFKLKFLFSSAQFSHSVVSNSLRPHESQHTRPPCPSPTPGVYSNSCPSSRWCHPAISSSVVPFSSCPQSLPASGSFPVSQLFAWGDQSISLRVIQNQSNELSLNQNINLSSIKRKTPTIMGWIYMVNTRLWSFKFKSSTMLGTIKSY